jgi:hypothetical protein
LKREIGYELFTTYIPIISPDIMEEAMQESTNNNSNLKGKELLRHGYLRRRANDNAAVPEERRPSAVDSCLLCGHRVLQWCDIEVLACLSPRYDLEQYGFMSIITQGRRMFCLYRRGDSPVGR